MSLLDKLAELIGHEVLILQTNETANEDGNVGMLPSIIREVGVDFLVAEGQVEKEDEDNPDESLVGTFETVVNTSFIARVIHMMPECSGCLVDSLNGNADANP